MDKASHQLIHEHNSVLIALDVLETICNQLQENSQADVKDIEDIIDFLKIFVDKCHHSKEEGFLFPALEDAGMQHEYGPIGVMLNEHQQGRQYIRQITDSVENGNIQKDIFIKSATSYIHLLRNHIAKENNVLFPMSDEMLSDSTQEKLLQDFEHLEENVIGEGKHEEFHQLLAKLKEKYLK